MTLKLIQNISLAVLITCTFPSFAHSVHSQHSPHHKLIQLNQQIDAMQHSLAKDRYQQTQWQQALKNTELTSAKLSIALHNTQHILQQHQHKIEQLTQQARSFQDHITTLRYNLSKELKTAYILGNQPQLKLLLSQQGSNSVDRTLMYFQYLEKQRMEDIQSIRNLLSQAKTNLESLQLEYKSLQAIQAKELNEISLLHHTAKHRQTLIKHINHDIHSKKARLQQMQLDKKHLEITLRNLSKNNLYYAAIGKPFSRLEHQLSRPTKGKIVEKFGTKIQKSQLRWKGVLIKAPMNQAVYAVADGKVVFADWMPGYGLLMIIYHGQGYMTLYGRNHYLYKKTGDLVQAGDQIAAVGESGGFTNSALYFAIRHSTQALNPAKWIRR